jgi:hypothetical protein
MFMGAVGCNEVQPSAPKKAIIMVTPLFGGGLLDSETGDNVWDPFAPNSDLGGVSDIFNYIFANLTEFAGILGPLLNNSPETSVFAPLAMTQYGESVNPNIIPANYIDPEVNHIYYGALSMFKDLIIEVKELYGSEYDVKMFNYDWRLDNGINSQNLEVFIDENNYSEVVLISHSMGGLVVSGYLSKNDVNYKKVKAYIPMSAPFLGSFEAIKYLNDVDRFVSNLFNSISGLSYNNGVLTMFSSIHKNLNITIPYLQEFIRNCPSIIQLLPSYDMLLTAQYNAVENDVGFTIDSKAIKNSEDLYNFYSSQSWSFLRDENGAILKDDNGQDMLKPFVENLKQFHESMFVINSNGERVHATSLVNTYYLVGQGYTTTTIYEQYQGTDIFGTTLLGDGTVPIYSQTSGLSTDLLSSTGKLYLFKGTHGETGTWSFVRDRIIPLLSAITGIA